MFNITPTQPSPIKGRANRISIENLYACISGWESSTAQGARTILPSS